MIPFGLLVFFTRTSSKYQMIKWSLLAYTTLHLFYDYNAGNHGGSVTSLFYNGRFFIPAIPLFVLLLADARSGWPKRIERIAFLVFLSMLMAAIGVVHNMHRQHAKVANVISDIVGDETLYVDKTAYRYVNPFVSSISDFCPLESYRQATSGYILMSRAGSGVTEEWSNVAQSVAEESVAKVRIRDLFHTVDRTDIVLFEIQVQE